MPQHDELIPRRVRAAERPREAPINAGLTARTDASRQDNPGDRLRGNARASGERDLSSRRILVASSVPLAAPWNGADKNLARLLVLRDTRNQFIVQTSADEVWPTSHVTPRRSSRVSAMPTTRQKLSTLSYLVRNTLSSEIIHVVTSLASSTHLTGRLLRAWSTISARPIVHTVPSIGDLPLDAHSFFADATVVLSDYTRHRLLTHGVRNVVRVYPPLDATTIRPRRPPDDLAQELNLGPRAVLYPAHYGERSGIAETVVAFAEVASTLEDAVLVLACRTHPWQDAKVEELKVRALARDFGIEQQVRIVGNVPDMFALISACAVTALVPAQLASKMDLPLVVLESLTLQRPVIVTDKPPINEALLGGGLAVQFGDIPGLAAAIRSLLVDPEYRDELGRRGRTEVLARCDPSLIVEQYQRIYSQVLSGPV